MKPDRFDSSKWIEAEVSKVADQAWRTMMRQEADSMYVYFRRGELIAVGADLPAPEGYELAHGERISGFWNRDQIRKHIRKFAGQLPCLPEVTP